MVVGQGDDLVPTPSDGFGVLPDPERPEVGKVHGPFPDRNSFYLLLDLVSIRLTFGEGTEACLRSPG